MSAERHKRAIHEKIRRAGGVENLPPAPEGPILPVFEPRALARLLKQEVHVARMHGWPKITMHMDVPDALALANALDTR